MPKQYLRLQSIKDTHFLSGRMRGRKGWITRPLRKTIDWLVVDTYEI